MTLDFVCFQELKPTYKTHIIMWGMGTPYSHIAMIGKDEDGKEWIFHAVGNGVCIQPSEEYVIPEERRIVRKKTVKMNCTVREFRAWVLGEKDKDYSETNLALIAICNKFKAKWMNGLAHTLFGDGDAERTCGELAAKALYLWSDEYRGRIGSVDLATPRSLELLLGMEEC